MSELTFWPTTWSRLAPLDVVLAPDGSHWSIGAAIQYDGTGEYLIEHPTRGAVWTTKRDDEPVSAARPPARSSSTEADALAVIREAFPLMEIIG